MKKIFFLMALLASSLVNAAVFDWVVIVSYDGLELSIDRNSLFRTGETITYFKKLESQPPRDGISTVIIKTETRCHKRDTRDIATIAFADREMTTIVGKLDIEPNFKPNGDGTLADVIGKTLCKLKTSKALQL